MLRLHQIIAVLIMLMAIFAPPGPLLAADGGKGAGPRLPPINKLLVALPDRASLDLLARSGYDIASVQTNSALVYADSEEVTNLSAAGWQFTIVPESSIPKSLGSYNSYADMTAMLSNYAASYPAICRLSSLGKSVQGRELWALKITTAPNLPADKPRFGYLSTFHGNEPLGTEMCLYLIDFLLQGYTTNDSRISNLVNNLEIWIVPLLNPDGRESSPPQRYNANGYDLNRNFPEGSGTNLGNILYGPPMRPDGLQPETQCVMAWAATNNITLAANFHTGAVVVNYPYDNDGLGSVPSPSPDEDLFVAMSRSYSSNNPPMWGNNTPPFVNGVVNGADWYAVSGGLQDWVYRYLGGLDVTIELSTGQWPSPTANTLPLYWSQNRESMLTFMEWSLRGVRGVMRDAITGLPVRGALRVEGFHHLVFSDAVVGNFHRPLLPGAYNCWFYAPGYIPQRVTNVLVASAAATRLEVAQQPVNARFNTTINFQPLTATRPTGYLPDSGAIFATRSGGLRYGWESTLGSWNFTERRSGRSQDLRYDTSCQMQSGYNHTWEIAVPNGPYAVLIAAGDAAYTTGVYRIEAEHVVIADGAPTSADRWVEGLGIVVVTDGLLTISSGVGAVSNRIAFVEISALEPATIAQWRAVWFGSTNNMGLAADYADPDGDCLPNIVEYGSGSNPTLPDTLGLLTAGIEHGDTNAWLTCSFVRNTSATDLTWSVWATDELAPPLWTKLATWNAGTGWSGPGPVSEALSAPGFLRVTARDAVRIGTTNRFMRVQINARRPQ